jgi:tight adherence protein C
MLLIIFISTFVCITLGAMGVYWLLNRPQSAATERLKRMGFKGGAATQNSISVTIPDESPATELAERLAQPLNKMLPPSAIEARKLQKQLMHAGFRSASAPVIYRAIQLISMGAFPLVVAFIVALLGRPLASALIWIILAFVAGFFLPRWGLRKFTTTRQRNLRWGLADALDLMVVSVEAGLGLNAAMVKVSSELRDVHEEIALEFELSNLEIRVGRERDEALRNLAERCGIDDLHSLVAMLIQTDKFGTSVAKGLRVFSDSLRTKRRQRAEQAAQKAAVKLLFPLACFLFPTLFIAILGPAAINLYDTLGNM